MKSKWPFLILVSLLVLSLWYVLRDKPQPTSLREESTTTESDSTTGENSVDNMGVPASDTSTSGGTGTAATDAVPPVTFEARLQEISNCLKLPNSKPGEESQDMDFFSLNSALADKFGGYRDEDDVWASTEITTPSGERRRILIDYRDGHTPLSYMAIQPDGSQKRLDLSAEQSNEPSEALLASLESDGTVVARARERVVNYLNGQQLTIREVDGKIYSYSLVQGDRTYKCERQGQNQNPLCSCSE